MVSYFSIVLRVTLTRNSRIDLNPPQPEQPEQPEHEAHEEQAQAQAHEGHEGTEAHIEAPQPVHDPTYSHNHNHNHGQDRGHSRPPRRLTGYLHHTLNVRRMRDATVEERLAALRSVREESARNPASSQEEADEQRRRNRLSTRLRERLRIGSRGQETEATTTT